MKKFKSIMQHTLFSTLVISAGVSYADSTAVTNINQSPKASVMTGLTIAVGENAGTPTSFYQSRDCHDAAQVYMNSDSAIMAYETMNVAAAKAKGIDCKAEFKPEEVAVYTWASFSLCHLKDNDTPLVDAKQFGMAGMHPYKKWISEFNQKNNANLQLRLYGGSGATMKGLLAKEIDWGFIATAVAKKASNQALISCDYNTDPRSNQYLGNFFKHDLADLRIKVAILAKGPEQDRIKKGLQSDVFTKYLTKYGYSFIKYDFDEESMLEWDREFSILQSFYE